MTKPTKSPAFEIPKNDYNVIRISLDRYKDIPFISIRQYFKDIDGEFKPTKKGVTLPPEKAESLINALQKISEEHTD